MTVDEVKMSIQHIPLGSKIQLIKNDGSIVDVTLASYEVEGTERKDYGDIEVPALPPAIIVRGGSRFGKFRMDIEDIVKIAWVN